MRKDTTSPAPTPPTATRDAGTGAPAGPEGAAGPDGAGAAVTGTAWNGSWDDGLIARRVRPGERVPGAGPAQNLSPDPEQATAEPDEDAEAPGKEAGEDLAERTAAEAAEEEVPQREPVVAGPPPPPENLPETPQDLALRMRLGALRELVGLSRTRLDGNELAEAGRVLDEAAARTRLPRAYTTVALAGATGSGKSTLFNALAGAQLSEAGVRRPTTSGAVSCTWDAGPGPGPEGLLERLGIPGRARRRAHVIDPALRGLILLDLPDYDSFARGHREQADRLLSLVDAVIWVVDPEKYADAVLHERYLRAFAGHAEVSFIVLNQIDRLPGEAADAVLHDVRRLLDDRGIALDEHGEPGATVLGVSALNGEGVPELRRAVGELVAERTAAARRLTADVDGAARRLRPVYLAESVQAPAGLTARAREEFEDRLASAVGAEAVGQAAERVWLRRADLVCGTPWAQLVRRLADGRAARRGEPAVLSSRQQALLKPPVLSRPALDQAVRRLEDDASAELPPPWEKAVRSAARRGARDLPRAMETELARLPGRAAGERRRMLPFPGWWMGAAVGQAVLLAAQLLGLCWMLLAVFDQPVVARWLPLALLGAGAVGAPLLSWCCRLAARTPARAWGQEEETRLRRIAAACGRNLVLEPVAAELLRYREAREQYVVAAGRIDPG
ncbi:50S ribosome-binding GTPase [Streptomyces sp. ACA25]|uniref:GTPase n=1 Tax=Streptomyces sp. ACA25 TaxID=3022596 RepID=UPI002307CE17|nr:GTPase [Streptomyces sp. ACA25]MDB1086763.1 50S ribosome-binding GTPase [Streptomyces sp. ACA25]